MRAKWTVSVDLDGVLAELTSPDKYSSAKPIRENINKVNTLYEKGVRVVIYTSRGWYNYDATKAWLDRQGVKYTELVMGKLWANYYIDDLNATLDEVLTKFMGESNKASND